MNVLIVSTNRCREPAPVMPVGACLAAEAALRAGHQVELLDLMFAGDPVASLRRTLARLAPRVVGLSVRNLDNTSMEDPQNFVPELVPLARTVRSESAATFVLGGAAAGIMPEELLRLTGADWVVCGAGERTFPALLTALDAGGRPEEIPGLGWLETGGFRQGPAARECPGEFLFPDYSRWLDTSTYRRHGATAPVLSKRGCPFDCIYCPCPRIEGKSFRFASPERVAEEVVRLTAAGFRDIEFVDNVFNLPVEHALEICREITRRRLPVRLHTHELNPAFVDDELLTAMERAGFASVALTAESAATDVLAGLGKNFGTEELLRAAAAVRRHRLPCLWVFMLGGPGETADTVQETLEFARRQVRSGDAAFFAVGIRIYPGTHLERLARLEGIYTGRAEELLAPAFYLSPSLDLSALQHAVRAAVIERPNFIRTGMPTLRLLPGIRALAGLTGVRPPLWRYTALIRKLLGRLGIREKLTAKGESRGTPPPEQVATRTGETLLTRSDACD
ncbi:MAG TPA: radical SAM protein [Desulfuromonadales bacterium]|nr:radical SAM protein [Desulfuromonadales bacterium]